MEWQYELSDCVSAIARQPQSDCWLATSVAGELVAVDASGKLEEIVPASSLAYYTIDCSRGGKYIAAGGESGVTICGGDTIQHFPHPKWVDRVAWHPTRDRLAYSYGDRVSLIDADDLAVDRTLEFTHSSVFDLAWHPDGSQLAVAGYRGVKIWSSADFSLPPVELPLDTATTHLSYTADGQYLAAANLDKSIAIFDRDNFADPWLLQGCPSKIRALTWGKDARGNPGLAAATGAEIAWWGRDDEIDWQGSLWSGHQGTIRSIEIHPLGGALLSASEDGWICIRSLDGEIIDAFDTDRLDINTAIWHPSGNSIIIGTRSGELSIWA
jgi:WD40 repeat protein